MSTAHHLHVYSAKHSLSQRRQMARTRLKRVSKRSNRIQVNKKLQKPVVRATRNALRVGFVPLTDCAPLAMAQELGLFRKHGLRVKLSRELGWATIRDKIIHRELDAAHALAGMPFAATLGIGSIRCDCLTALVLNLHGDAITLSNSLRRHGVRDGKSLREEITRSAKQRTFTFGVVFPSSSHNFLLRSWLLKSGIHPDRDVRIVTVPPPQMVANLKAGHLDGFCVGEPWNSVAVRAKVGWCAGVSAELDPGHPEKVLMARNDFVENHADDHLALVAALLEACEYCDAPENRSPVVATLARPAYVGIPAATLESAFGSGFDFGDGCVREVPDLTVFHRYGANEPSREKAAWIIRNLKASGPCKDDPRLNPALGQQIFRDDLYRKAACLLSEHPSHCEYENNSEMQIA
jgi:ABC-type nitrate/sulfonate/bicarbonate transport system substrate-binding protein